MREDRPVEKNHCNNRSNIYHYCECRNAAALLDSHNPAAR